MSVSEVVELAPYGMRLFDNHQELLRASAIDPDVARERGYVSVDTKTRLEHLDFEPFQRNTPGLLIPVWSTRGEIALHQYRPDQPRERQGKPVKYETPTGGRMVLDVHPRARAELDNPHVPLVITEGVRKADAAVSKGLCCIALLGVWNWRGTNDKGGTTALADWDDIALNGRTTYLAFDSDMVTKPKVQEALRRLSASLSTRKANVIVLRLPEGDDGAKVGLDDYFAAGHTVDELLDLTWELPEEGTAENAEAEREILRVTIASASTRARVDGASFILDAPTQPVAIWGEGDQVLIAQGEPTMLAGGPGVGKTTLGQQYVLARLGLREDVLGFPVQADDRPVLYIAADRPAQAARSMRRMVTEDDAKVLSDRFIPWQGPLPHDLARHPEQLAVMAEMYDAGTIVIDSLKDLAVKLSDDEVGGRVNLAMQQAALAGVEVLANHHQRKGQQGVKKPRTVDEVYGSTWLTAGMGSVILLWGEPGDLAVELSHLKQPAEDVGPLSLLHNHVLGLTTVQQGVDLLVLVQAGHGLTATEGARQFFGTTSPKQNEIEKVRRRLDRFVKEGWAVAKEGAKPTRGGAAPTVYYPAVRGPE